MRRCGACRQAIRWDESLATLWLERGREPGYYQACPRCVAVEGGTEPPVPRRYPPGEVPPHPHRDDLLPICGLCREALFEGETTQSMRVDDVDDPGVYEVCPRCRKAHLAQAHARLVRHHIIPADCPIESLAGRMLL